MHPATDTTMGTRERLLEAAIGLIESEGEHGLRVDRVVEIAGFTKPVLYHYFTDREGIIAAAQAERFRRALTLGVNDALDRVMNAQSPEEFLALMLELAAPSRDAAGRERRWFRMEVLGSSIARPKLMASVAEATRAHVDLFEKPLQIAAQRGWVKPDVPARDLALWWQGAVLGRFLFEIDPDNYDAANWDRLTDFALRSMVRLRDES